MLALKAYQNGLTKPLLGFLGADFLILFEEALFFLVLGGFRFGAGDFFEAGAAFTIGLAGVCFLGFDSVASAFFVGSVGSGATISFLIKVVLGVVSAGLTGVGVGAAITF